MACDIAADSYFGPNIQCDQFDFTLCFEQTVFGVGFSIFFVLFLPFRINRLLHAAPLTLSTPIYGFKIGLGAVLVGLRLVSLSTWARNPVTRVSLAAAVWDCISIFGLALLVALEHNRSPRPSSYVTLYLLSTGLGDAIQMRTLLMRNYIHHALSIESVGLFGKILLLIIESWPKGNHLKPSKRARGPEELAGILDRTFFWWLNSLFQQGYRNSLSLSDLPELDYLLSVDHLQRRFQKSRAKCSISNKQSLIYTHLRCFRRDYLQTVIPRLGMICFSYGQTFLISATITYLETPANKQKVTNAYGLIGSAALIYVGLAVSTATYNRKLARVITKFRGATMAEVSSKSLLGDSHQDKFTTTVIVSTDVDQVAAVIDKVADIWAKAIEVLVGVWLLYRKIGPVSAAPIIIVTLSFVGQAWTSQNLKARQASWAEAMRQRVGISSMVLRSMKSIRLSGLSRSMESFLQLDRLRELQVSTRYRWISIQAALVANIPDVLSAFVVFAWLALHTKSHQDPPFSTSEAFTSIAIISLLSTPVANILYSTPYLVGAMISLQRIQGFLDSKSFSDFRSSIAGTEFPQETRLDLTTASEKPLASGTENTQRSLQICANNLVLEISSQNRGVKPINFEVRQGTLTMVLGPIGCGKSTLLKAILGEVKPVTGNVAVSATHIGYCSQTPWLPNVRIRDCICAEKDFEPTWYDEIIQVCDLQHDLARMPERDLTEVGSLAISLSGGQKHRIALARALYSRCSLLVLDDFLSSLDSKTSHSITRKLFSTHGHMKRHQITIILATQLTEYIDLSTTIVVLDGHGNEEYCGPPQNWTSVDNELKKGGQTAHSELGGVESLVTPALEIPQDILRSISVANETEHSGSNVEDLEKEPMIGHYSEEEVASQEDQALPKTLPTKTLDKRGDWHEWLYYGSSIGKWPAILIFLAVFVSTLTSNFPKLWVQSTTSNWSNTTRGTFVGTYALICFATFTSMFLVEYLLLIVMAQRSGVRLHYALIQTTFTAPMSYFESVDTSVLLNRFSQDLSLIDTVLPQNIWGLLNGFFMSLFSGGLVTLGSRYLVTTLPVTIFVIYWIQRFYLQTSRQIRFLALETSSPLHKHFTEVIEGRQTIRAFGWEKFFARQAAEKLDNSQRAYYVLLCIQRKLNLTIDLIVSSLAVLMIAFALCIPKYSSGGALGIALSSTLQFNSTLKGFINSWTQVETSLGSVSRIASFERDTPREICRDDELDPGKEWPRGEVTVSNVSLKHSNGMEALKGISFRIRTGQKLGVCGRTGSGKSSLLSLFLRLTDPTYGAIWLDEFDITRIPRRIVQDRIICLPQDALILPGTFRFNIDPQNQALDNHSILCILARLDLLELVARRGGLTANIVANSLSQGEQQLLVLARAILRRNFLNGNCILILDEATSNLDTKTEALFQEVVREEFGNNTVVTVAHRIDALRDVDYVISLEDGKIVRAGTPGEVIGEIP